MFLIITIIVLFLEMFYRYLNVFNKRYMLFYPVLFFMSVSLEEISDSFLQARYSLSPCSHKQRKTGTR